MRNSELQRWLWNKGFFSPNEGAKRCTHLCMDGGKLYVPDNSMLDFWKQLEIAYNNGEYHFICEPIYDPIRRFYMDFDFKEDHVVELDYMKRVIKKVNDTITEYFSVVFSAILCSSPSIDIDCVNKETGEVTKKKKIGYHIIWPNLILNKQTSIALCQIILQELIKFDNKYDWDQKIVDFDVYTVGLRMIGMWKMAWEKVQDEKRKKKRIIEKRPYIPVYKYPEEPEYFDGNWLKYLCDCSIRSPFIDDVQPYKPVKPIAGVDVVNEKEILHELTLADAIQSYIRRYIPVKEWDEEVTEVKPMNSGTWYVVRTKSRFCANIGGEHNSENIYFKIYTHGFVQKCFCRCNTLEGRKDGLCKNFQSKKYKLSEKLFKLLFPNKKQKQKEKLALEKNDNIYLPIKTLTKNNLNDYLKMSLNTLKNIEKKCL